MTCRVVLLLALVVALTARAAQAQGVDETCVLSLTQFDPAVVNVAYPDDSAQYYTGNYQLIPGTRVRISGEFPHARYMSFNAYDLALRPLDGVSDVRIAPDAGSANPFLLGADRTTTTKRSYTVFIEYGARPEHPAPNTLYVGAGQDGSPNTTGTFIYRIYIPDKGRDDRGGVGLPTAQIEPTSSTGTPGTSPCADVHKPTVGGINELLAAQALPDTPSTTGANPPVWRKFVNLVSSVAINVTGEPDPGGVDFDTLGGNGGFLSNLDNAYVSAPMNRAFGPIVVTRVRAPTVPDTRPPADRMPGGQLRYWSMCENDPPTQRFVACINDDRAVIDRDGFATFVMSVPGTRPPKATRECGVNWMPWGPNQRSVVIYRNMLPDPAFTHSIQGAKVDKEAATMGDHLPASRYYASPAEYDAKVGCGTPASPVAAAGRGPCTSRRRITVTLPRAHRSASEVRLTIAGRGARTVPVRRGRVVVDLRRAPSGRYAVTIRVGTRIIGRRAYRTCARRGTPA